VRVRRSQCARARLLPLYFFMVSCLIVWHCGNAGGDWPAGDEPNRPALNEVRCQGLPGFSPRSAYFAPDVILTAPFMAIVDIIIVVQCSRSPSAGFLGRFFWTCKVCHDRNGAGRSFNM
jgi:hypothetical protein